MPALPPPPEPARSELPSPSTPSWSHRLSSFPGATWLALAVTAVLWSVSLTGGFSRDDYGFFAANEEDHRFWSNTRWDAWRFLSGEPEEMKALIRQGALPWFTLPELKFALWRPLSSATIAATHALFAHNALGWHLVQYLFYLAAVAAVAVLYRRVLPVPLGALSLLVFAVDDGHWDLSHLGSRYQMVVLIPCALALVAHVRWREDGWRAGRPLAVLGFALGLLGGESALSFMAYLLAYEWVMTSGGSARLRALVPYGLLALAYTAAYKLLGHGIYGRMGYVDPLAEPAAFLPQAAFNFLAHLGNMFTGGPRYVFERLALARSLSPLPIAALVVLLLAFLWVLRRALRTLPAPTQRTLTWLIAGAVLAVIPGLGGPITDRIIFASTVGASAAIVVVARYGWQVWRGQWETGRVARRGVPLVCAAGTVTHVVLAPLFVPLLHLELRRSGEAAIQVLREAEIPPGTEDVVQVVASSTNLMLNQWAGYIREFETGQRTRHWWVFGYRERDDQVLTRRDANTLEVALASGDRPDIGMEAGFRDPRRFPLVAGQEVDMDGFSVRVLEAVHGVATRFEARFDRPLDDPRLAFITLDATGHLRRVAMPPVGGSLTLPAVLPRSHGTAPERDPSQSSVPRVVR